MKTTFVYDDLVEVPAEVAALTGISRFGDLLFRKRVLSDYVMQLAGTSGISNIVHLKSAADVRALDERLLHAPPDHRYIYYPSNLVAPAADECEIFQIKSGASTCFTACCPNGCKVFL